MQVWRFYLIKDKTRKVSQWHTSLDDSWDKNDEPTEKYYPLYAMTSRKKLAKAFMRERDMNKFIVNRSDVDPDAWKTFANDNNSKLINYHELTTGSNTPDEDGLYRVRIRVLMTEGEFISCGSMHDDDEALSTQFGSLFEEYQMISPFLFTDEFRKPLIALKYPSVFVLESSDENYDAWDQQLWKDGNDLYYYHDNLGAVMKMTVDELKYFITDYRDLFK